MMDIINGNMKKLKLIVMIPAYNEEKNIVKISKVINKEISFVFMFIFVLLGI